MVGVDNRSFRPIDNLGSAIQSVETILGTSIGSRLMRREFGGGVLELLGRPLTPSLFSAWMQVVATAIDLWEPRFRVRRFLWSGSVEEIRRGHAALRLEVDFRPRGHLGDFTVDRVLSVSLNFADGNLAVGF